MQFLSSASAIASKVEEMIASQAPDSPVRIAVAFWGGGSESVLARTDKTFHVICNLKAGGSNPNTIGALMERSHVYVRQLDTLHAKVVVADSGAVVSSANFSTNGLGLGGASFQTWNEAGVHLPSSAACMPELSQWFVTLWSASREITEDDLAAAQATWALRTDHASQLPAVQEATTAEVAKELLSVRTVQFLGRAKPGQLHVRSAAALVALNGCQGEPMPHSAFSFLFSGETLRAFENHQEKFEVVGNSVRIRSAFVGYFVGANGTMDTCTDPKRRKSFSPELVPRVARWMLCKGNRPVELEGTEINGKFTPLASSET